MRRLLLASRGNKFALVLSLDPRLLADHVGPSPHGRLRGAVVARALIPTIPAGRAVHESHGATAVVQNLVVGLVVVALIIIGVFAYAPEHEGCLHGRSLQTFKPCGSVGVDL
jgi:hypothetical protein